MEKATYFNGTKRRYRVEVFALGPDNTILACPNGWVEFPDLPGGGVDKNETPELAGMRELREESGWLADNFKYLNIPGEWIFRGQDDPWFNKDGWNEEVYIPVICNAINFAPCELYGSEGDALEFKLLPIEQIKKETEDALNEGLSTRKQIMMKFRLAVFKELESNTINVSQESIKPFYFNLHSLETYNANHYSVYVIELSHAVLNEKKFKDKNPQYKHGLCVYVGMTGLSAELRYLKHKDGIKSNVYVQRYGVKLLPELGISNLTFEDAKVKEIELANAMRARGLAVWQA